MYRLHGLLTTIRSAHQGMSMATTDCGRAFGQQQHSIALLSLKWKSDRSILCQIRTANLHVARFWEAKHSSLQIHTFIMLVVWHLITSERSVIKSYKTQNSHTTFYVQLHWLRIFHRAIYKQYKVGMLMTLWVYFWHCAAFMVLASGTRHESGGKWRKDEARQWLGSQLCISFSAFTLLVVWQERHPSHKNNLCHLSQTTIFRNEWRK